MLKNILALLVLLSATACSSGGDTVENLFDDVPVDGSGSDAIAQAVPNDVPEVDAGFTYYGKKAIILDKLFEMNIRSGVKHAAFDGEYKAKANQNLIFDQLGSLYIGSCDSEEKSVMWMEVDSKGKVIDTQDVNVFGSVEVKKGKRYLLRVEFKNLSGCGVYTSLTMKAE